MTGGSLTRITIRVALRKPLPKPSPAYGSRFKNDDRQEGAKIKTWKPVFSPDRTTDDVTGGKVKTLSRAVRCYLAVLSRCKYGTASGCQTENYRDGNSLSPFNSQSRRPCSTHDPMCGRFTNRLTWREIVALYRLTVPATPERNLPARYNICPTTTIDAVIERDAERELVPMRWGLVPSWWKKKAKETPATFNTRAETVAEKPMFRSAFKRTRCLRVIMSGMAARPASSPTTTRRGMARR